MDPFKSKRRTHTINFRLSEEEFRDLKRACAAGGARSVSDFARTAIWRMVIASSGAEPGSGAGKIEDRLAQLQQQLAELAGLFREGGQLASAQEPVATIAEEQTA